MLDKVKLCFGFLLEVVRKFKHDRLTRHASALSFSSLLALAPMMALAFSMLSLFSSFEEIRTVLENFIFQFLVPTAGEDVRNYIEQFAGQAGKLTFIGLIFFFLTALLLLFTIEESFNDIWGVKKGRSLGARLTVYWALISLGPLLMGAGLSTSVYLLSMATHGGDSTLNSGFTLFGVGFLPFAFEMLAFLLLYLVMPNVRVSLIHGLFGALVATVLFELTKKLFGLYILNFNNYEVIYGALSTLPVLLIWIYLSWVVALTGAECVSVLQQRQAQREAMPVSDEVE